VYLHTVKIRVFWVVTGVVVDNYQSFGATDCLHLQCRSQFSTTREEWQEWGTSEQMEDLTITHRLAHGSSFCPKFSTTVPHFSPRLTVLLWRMAQHAPSKRWKHLSTKMHNVPLRKPHTSWDALRNLRDQFSLSVRNVDWIHLDHDRGQWWAFGNKV